MKRILSILLVLFLLVPLCTFTFGCKTAAEAKFVLPDASQLKEFKLNKTKKLDRVDGESTTTFYLAQSNNNYELYLETDSMGIALKSKATGEVWYSNPSIPELTASGGKKDELSSQVKILYMDKKTNSQYMKNTYTDSVNAQSGDTKNAISQYYITYGPDNTSLRIVYIIGKIKKDFIIPLALTVEEYNRIANIKLENKMRLDGKYTFIDYKTWSNYTGEYQSKLMEIMPSLGDFTPETPPVYLLINQAALFASDYQSGILEKLFTANGYDEAKRDEVNAFFGIQKKEPDLFWLPLDYILTEDGLKVSVDTAEVKYNNARYDIINMDILPYMGYTTPKDNGYMLVPDGSGALINLNNNRNPFADPLRVQMYGYDWGHVTNNATKLYQGNIAANEQGYLPVFGIKRDSSSLFAIIEQGAAVATITADVSRITETSVIPNYIFSSFKMVDTDELKLWGQDVILTAYQSKRTQGAFQVQYSILPGDKGSYSDMAAFYRNYLTAKGVFANKTAGSSIPFQLDLVGAIEDMNGFLGIQYKYLRALTTYKQAEEIIGKLTGSGVSNLNVRLMGFSNNGLQNTNYSSIAPLNQLGGAGGFKELLAYAKQKGVKLFPEADLIRVYRDVLFDNYNSLTSFSKQIGRANTNYYQFSSMDPNSYYNVANIVKPQQVQSNGKMLQSNYKGYNSPYISLGSLGKLLTGDYNIHSVYDRGMVANVYAEVAKGFADTGYTVAASGTNSYLLPYTSVIYDLPNKSSSYFICDITVPFYQMVVHGYIPYSGEAINQTGDPTATFLQAVEFGAGLSFRWSYASNDALINLFFEGMFSLSYESWLDDAQSMYQRYNSQLADTADKTIVWHQRYDADTAVTMYSNGTQVYVNYSDSAKTVNGVQVPAKDFTVVKGG